MIYEFIGLPGAGKSYKANQKKTEKNLQEIKISSMKQRLQYAVIFAIKHPFFFIRLLFIFVKENYKNLRLLKHKLSTVILEIVALEQKAGKGPIVVETGFFHLLLSLYERKINEHDIAGIMQWLKKRPYMIYIVEAQRKVRDQRMQDRGRVPRSGIISDKEKLNEWLFVLEYNFDVIKKAIINNFNYEIIENN